MASVKPRPGYGYEVRYIDPATGKRPSKTFKLKKDADAYRRKVEREIEDGVHTADGDTMTVRAVADEFLRYTRQRCADGRIGINRQEELRVSVERFLIPAMGSKLMSQVAMIDVERLFEKLVKDGRKSITARSRIHDLKQVQDYALKRGWTKTKPFDEALVELKGIRRARIRVPTQDEVAALMAAVSRREPNCTERSRARLECMLHLAAFCGLRLGEQLGLKLEHLRIDARMIEVRHSLLQNRDTLKGPKTAAGIRDVPLPDHLGLMLQRYIAEFYVAGSNNPHGLVFRTQKGVAFDAATLHKQWHDLIARAGIDETAAPLRWHSLRHFCASWLIRNGMPVTDAAQMLGHGTFDMTLQVYAHPTMTTAVRHEAMGRSIGPILSARDATVTQKLLSH